MRKNRIVIDIDKCKGCKLCTIECKEGIITISKEVNKFGYNNAMVIDMSKCTGCTMCAISCPEGIIEVIREEED